MLECAQKWASIAARAQQKVKALHSKRVNNVLSASTSVARKCFAERKSFKFTRLHSAEQLRTRDPSINILHSEQIESGGLENLASNSSHATRWPDRVRAFEMQCSLVLFISRNERNSV